MKKSPYINVVSSIFASFFTLFVALLFLKSPNQALTDYLPKAYAQAGTKAVTFVIGDTCPPGFQDPVAAGFGSWQNRFPLMVSDTADNLTAPTGTLQGGAVVSGGSLTHSHSISGGTGGNVGGLQQRGGGGWSVPVDGHSHSVSGSSNSVDHTPSFIKLKPCVWNLN